MANGESVLEWKAPRAFRVLYIEGELPGQELQERISLLVGELDNFMVVTPEAQPGSTVPSIATDAGRRLLEDVIAAHQTEVVFLDSISTLANIPTNDEEEWLALLDWFKFLRNKHGIALFYLQHDGKKGLQRGHSKHGDILEKSVHLLAIFAAWDLSLRSRAFRPLLDYLVIEADGLFGDRGPAEGLFDAPPSSISEMPAPLRILKEPIDLESEIPRKLFGIGGKTCDRILIEGNQISCFSVNDDLFNASCSACNHGRAASHCFEVDDSERFVD
jgi:AAA domain-containing protein